MSTARRVLVVDDERALAEAISESLGALGYAATASHRASDAEGLLAREPFDALVTDLRMPGTDGLDLLAAARRLQPELPVIVMTAFSAVDTAIESIRRGAFHYLTKPFKTHELDLFLQRAFEGRALRRETRQLKAQLDDEGTLVGGSEPMVALRSLVHQVADSDATVLVLGETGVGKGLVARALHQGSRRAAEPFLTVNCAALPETLLESELFGHARGAFTGAVAARDGLFIEAGAGTLFLDEVGDMSAAVQARLLDVLERRVVRPVGSNRERPIEARVVAATHRDLAALARAGTFRDDLRYRLEVIPIEVPSLRVRPGDLPALAEHFIERARARHPRAVATHLSAAALERLVAHAWPGNVRELQHALERAVLLGQHAEISTSDLPAALASAPGQSVHFGEDVVPLRELQRRYVRWALERVGGRKMLAAEKLDIDPKTLARWLGDGEP